MSSMGRKWSQEALQFVRDATVLGIVVTQPAGGETGAQEVGGQTL